MSPRSPVDTSNLGSVPVREEPPWLPALRTQVKENKPAGPVANYITLATSRAPPEPPAARTVVFRGILGDVGHPSNLAAFATQTAESALRDMLVICTDTRSEKVKEVERFAGGEVCWYFPHTRHQLRLTGIVHILPPPTHPLHSSLTARLTSHIKSTPGFDLEKERLNLWNRLSPGMKASFAGPAPGTAKENSTGAEVPVARLDIGDLPEEHFALVLFEVERAEMLDLSPGKMERRVFQKRESGSWEVLDLNP